MLNKRRFIIDKCKFKFFSEVKDLLVLQNNVYFFLFFFYSHNSGSRLCKNYDQFFTDGFFNVL